MMVNTISKFYRFLNISVYVPDIGETMENYMGTFTYSELQGYDSEDDTKFKVYESPNQAGNYAKLVRIDSSSEHYTRTMQLMSGHMISSPYKAYWQYKYTSYGYRYVPKSATEQARILRLIKYNGSHEIYFQEFVERGNKMINVANNLFDPVTFEWKEVPLQTVDVKL